MSTSERFARIAITLPQSELAAADRLATAQDRSRSWIVAEAIRRYVASLEATSRAAAPSVHDALPTATAMTSGAYPEFEPGTRPGLGTSRLSQLQRDLALTPEARVRAAEETLRQIDRGDDDRTHRGRSFARYEDFLDYKRNRSSARD